MSFEVEWLDEEARKVNYVDSSFWLVDKERDIQFWLSLKGWQLRAEGDRSQDFKLRIDGKKFEFKLMPDPRFGHFVEGEIHQYVWDRVVSYRPKDLHGYAYGTVISIIREALRVEGALWYSSDELLRSIKKVTGFVIKFNF